MPVDVDSIKALLREVKSKYSESAKADIVVAITNFPGLNVGSEKFLFPDGNRKLAFRLKGTIPVPYKGKTYNIPIALYLWDTHPYYAPICSVCPTSNMMIKESKTVDKQGRIYLPYLSDWRSPGYDLCGLLQVMVCCFQEKSPLFARPAVQPAISAGLPQPTVYRPFGFSSQSSTQSQPSLSSYVAPNPPDRPPYPLNAPCVPKIPRHQSLDQNSVSSSQSNISGTVQPEHLRASFMSAIEDKLRKRLRDKLGKIHAETASIQQTHADLRAGQQELKAIKDQLTNERKNVEKVLNVFKNKKAEIVSVLSSCNAEEDVEIDSIIEASTPLHRQCLECYVEDCAIDDAIYFLGQGLKSGRLSLEKYLKMVRQLSRKQFICRATVIKCRMKAKLPV